jgi:signal transduction histidine kinase
MISKKILKGTFHNTDEKKLLKVMTVLETSVDRLSSLVENLLDVSRINLDRMVLHKETLNLKTVFEDLFDRYQSTIALSKTDVSLIIESDVTGEFDRLRIEQVFLNLLVNSLKYGEQKPVRIHLKQEGNVVYLSFHDNGTGIPKNQIDKIFERYEKIDAHKNVSGLGLGLYITKEIVMSHGGSITVDSEVGRGTTFKVILPV